VESTQQFIQYLSFEKRYSKLTVQAYQKDLEQFFLFIGLQYTISHPSQIKHLHIRSWIAQLKENNNANTSINRKISTLKSYFKFCLKQEFITKLPTQIIVAPKKAKRLPSYVPEKQMETLLEEIDFGEDFAGKTNRLLIELLYATGMRRSELKNIQLQDIDWHRKTIKILGKGNKERLIPLLPSIIERIEQYLEAKKEIEHSRSDFLLILDNGKPLYDKYIYLTVKKYLPMVSTLQKASPHVIRHSFATNILENGAQLNAVKELLGHSSLAATQVYTHNSIEKLKKVFQNAHPKA
jgi:integrase/recombinase XerC